jgi:4-amino-4-deoxy-L-arabinose transferase-like glycosyltransferase
MHDIPATAKAKQHDWLAVATLGLILFLGTGARLFGLGQWGMSHPEVYVPGIALPSQLVEFPLPRYTLSKVVIGCVRAEPSHLLYYVGMLGWTKLFGTDLIVLRLPSVFFGVAGIYLAYVLGKSEFGEASGLTAAALLALNGHHISWSQQARGYIVASALGLLSTVLVLRLARGGSRPKGALFLYIASTLAGLGTEVFYWPIFFIHMLWVALRTPRRPAVPCLLRWQLFILLLSGPWCALVAHQSRLPSHTVGSALPFLGEFLQFGFLFESVFGVDYDSLTRAALVGLALLALVLLTAGLSSTKVEVADDEPVLPEPPWWLQASALVVSLCGILGIGGFSYHFGGKRTEAIFATAVVPVAVLVLDRMLTRYWLVVRGSSPFRTLARLVSTTSLSGLLAVVPIASILAVSPIVPLFASRGVLVYTPYLVVVASRGLVALVRRHRGWLVIGLVLSVVHALSAYEFSQRPIAPRDHRALAQELATRVQPSDLIFLRGKHWQTTPIFYYLKGDRFRFVGEDYSALIAKEPEARVWAVTWEDNFMPPDMIDALRDYGQGEKIDVRGAHAVLYQRQSPHPDPEQVAK